MEAFEQKVLDIEGKELEYMMAQHRKILATRRLPLSVPAAVNTEAVFKNSGLSGITCRSCGIKNVRYIMRADRAADEGMTAHCICQSCGHQFKVKT